MANPEHLAVLEQGVAVWNEWRDEYRFVRVDLSNAHLSQLDLKEVDFAEANLAGAKLTAAKLGGADLSGANLTGADIRGAELDKADLSLSLLIDAELDDAGLVNADLSRANLNGADLTGADLKGSTLVRANFSSALLEGADLTRSDLALANLSRVWLKRADLSDARFAWTNVVSCDLRDVRGLDSVVHQSPSHISIDTIYESGGMIPEAFLLGCGVPDSFIAQIPALVGALQPIQFYSCFISYSTKDEEFARRLHERMRAAKLRVWFAPEDIQGGKKLHKQIERAIQVHDRLLLILSENSIHSEWVMTEIRNAVKVETKDRRRKLFPIRVCDFDTLRDWGCFDADFGKDLAKEVRQYSIPDFSDWKNHDDFEAAFAKLLRDLRASEP
jgi:hypothetical protein